MLKNVIGDYLDSVGEREFDLPFIALLPSLGFFDIHFTHSQVEFGKDFIAKRIDDGNECQYSFQLKAGNISQAEWRSSIMGQMLEAVISTLSHPNFDVNLPHQSILVITGKLSGNAALGLQNLNQRIENIYDEFPIEFWDKDDLLDQLDEHGLESIYHSTPKSLAHYGNFLKLFGNAVQNMVTLKNLEQQSRAWLADDFSPNNRLLGSAIEAELISRQLISSGYYYEAFQAILGFLRTILFQLHETNNLSDIEFLIEILQQAEIKLHNIANVYFSEFISIWENSNKNLVSITPGSGLFINYMIQCMRILEIIGFLFFYTVDEEERESIVGFLQDFINQEPGCTHVPSDFYAVSVILPALVLNLSDQKKDAQDYLKSLTIWLCDKYEEGLGLAPFGADEVSEISSLLGYAFDFVTSSSAGSFLATVIGDLSAFLGDSDLYSDIINDIKATNIFPTYWQPNDTLGLYQIDGEDVVSYPSVEYDNALSNFTDYNYAEHIKHEPKEFRLQDILASRRFMLPLLLFLRDRYFPTLWNQLG